MGQVASGGKKFFHMTSVIRAGITFSSAIKTWQKKAWKYILVSVLTSLQTWKCERGKKKEKTENTVRNFLLFPCTSGKQLQGKRGSTFMIHSFCRWQGAAGVKEKHSECFGALILLSMRSSMAGASVCTSNTLQMQSGAWRGSVRAAGTHSESQLSHSHFCLPVAAVGDFPMAWPRGWSITATSLTPAHPLTVGRDGLHEVYGPNVGTLQRDLGSKFCLQKGPACSWGRISLLAASVFFQRIARHPHRPKGRAFSALLRRAENC